MASPDIASLLEQLVRREGSDLYLVAGSLPSVRVQGMLEPLQHAPLTKEDLQQFIRALVPPGGMEEFEAALEYNTAIAWRGGVRLRINLFQQRQLPGMVIRRIRTTIPTLESLHVPPSYAALAMEARGLVLVVGPTGSGKSTSLAAMIGHRNMHSAGHIITIEDPIEFVHAHQKCIVSQRDVGIDTLSLPIALRNAMRQSPDVLMIGELLDAEVVQQALSYAETGHLVLSTMHASNAYQAIERLISFFAQEKHRQILLSLWLNLRGILSQRLMRGGNGERSLACEILLNKGLMRDLIAEGKIREVRDLMERSQDTGMQTFEQALFALVRQGRISETTALAECDNPGDLRLMLKQIEMHRKLNALQDGAARPF